MSDKSYFTHSKFVKEIDPSHFDSSNLKDEGCAVVLFYANWCPHCKTLAPQYEEMAKKATFMDVYAIDCARFPEFANDISKSGFVKGYPTIYFYKKGKPTQQYNNERLTESLLKMCVDECQPTSKK